MSLKKKTILIFLIIFGFLNLTFFVFSKTILKPGFLKIESVDAEKNIERVTETLNMQIENLALKFFDWSNWDDCYNYVANGNEEFIKSNLIDPVILDMDVNLFFLKNIDGTFRLAKVIDHEKQTVIDMSENLKQYFTNNEHYFNFKYDEYQKNGLILLPEIGPVFFTSQAVLTSEKKGPSMGQLFAAKKVDTILIEKIKKVTHLELELKLAEEAANDNWYKNIVTELEEPKKFKMVPIDTKTIASIIPFDDIFGIRIFYLKMTMDRSILAQGTKTINIFLLATLLSSVLTGIIYVFILYRRVFIK
ncbi:MAG: CHASE4 domain-containing protein [Bacteriovoracaceae bacterium]